MSERLQATAIVLAGGRSTRFGSDKAAAQLAGRSMLEWVVSTVAAACEDVVIVGGPERTLPGTRYIVEEGTPRGPLGGIVTGMRAARFDACFATGCDVPLLVSALVRMVLRALDGVAAAVPVVGGVPQPLTAAFSRGLCLPAFDAALAASAGGPIHALRSVTAFEIDEATVRSVDPGLRSFLNANTPEAFATLEALVRDAAP
ncbi:MAG: molybdenum cofactor guanylyltransferase [Dehalococcoidia bacterium]|nr:molybdenum cofactor guanylyltransferase [Dehalococcoidia bacterium]